MFDSNRISNASFRSYDFRSKKGIELEKQNVDSN